MGDSETVPERVGGRRSLQQAELFFTSKRAGIISPELHGFILMDQLA
jgi:hypothetical protein